MNAGGAVDNAGIGSCGLGRGGLDTGWCVIGLRRRAQRSDTHEPGQQYDHDHTTDRRGVLQSALACLGRLVIGDVVDVSSGGVGPADVTASSTWLSGKAFGAEPFLLAGAANAAGLVGAVGVVGAVAAVGAVGATTSDPGVARAVAGAASVLSVASRKMDAARNSDVARMCDRVPPFDSSALAKSRPRRYLSTGIFRERAGEDRVEFGQVRPDLAWSGRSIVELPVDHHGRIEMCERRCPGQHVKSAGRQSVLVGAAVEFIAHQLLGRGVARPSR